MTGGTKLALQLAFEPPFAPLHVQFHGPLPDTADAVPAEQRFDVGADENVPQFEVPHDPLLGRVQDAIVTPLGRAFLKAFHSAIVRVGISMETH